MLYEPFYQSVPFCAQDTCGIVRAPHSQLFADPFSANTVPTTWILEDNINRCANVINNYQDDLCYGENFGLSKTGKPIRDLPGAAQNTSLDAWMGGGNMYAGRDSRDQYNQALGYMMCLRDIAAIMAQQQYGIPPFNSTQISYQPPYLPFGW